ncbi:MAG: glycosyl hydrolase, partial [Fimbriimonadaceae bacterium]
LPAIAGYDVQNSATTERVLWDWRRTIADLYNDNYYKYFGELCHKAGLLFSTEPYGNGGFDNIQVGGTADIPMGEFWIGGGTLETTKIAASTGHVYGRSIIGAESFTADEGRGKWLEEPYAAKALGDFVFCNGVNRYIFHRYAHQPWMDKFPGMTMGPWGTHLERTQTWWTEAGTWMKYIARCQYLLQSGKFVADALYYYGEDTPVDLPYGPGLKPRLPAGYDYDGCDTNVVMNRLRVKNGKLVLPDGMTYAFLVLPERKTMTFKVASRIKQLVADGATIVGPKPETTPSLSEYPAFEAPLKKVADEVWGKVPQPHHSYGKGHVVVGKGLDSVLAGLKIEPDFSFSPSTGRTKMAYIHRRVGGAEVYFISNQNYRSINVDCTFRVSGLVPELWHPDSGVAEAAPVYRSSGKRTTIPLHLGPAESVFVVFRTGKALPHLTAFGSGTTTMPVPQRMPKIAIKSARYETAEGRGADVTELVSGMARSGQFEIEATNTNFGDPVVNVVKRLVIEYVLDGKEMKKTVAENEILVLWEAPNSPNATKTFDLAATSRGLEITPWKAGTFTGMNARGKPLAVRVKEGPKSLDLSRAWDVKFPPNWGAPPAIHLGELVSWSEHKDIGVKYFSGSAVYSKTFDVPASFVGKSKTILLELGRVKNFATVTLNGIQLEVLWKEPFAVDMSKALKAGRNRLDIKITNLWPNRIIGDEQLPPDVEWSGAPLKKWPDWLINGEPRPKTGRYTFTTWKYWNKDSTLLESGLLGPVVIRSAQRILIK